MTAPFDILTRIAERGPALRLAEQKVAQVVLEDLAGAAAASINELARQAGVSEASVTRFAKAIGCRDVRDLKLRLAQAAAVGARFLQPGNVPAAEAAPATLADSIHADILTALEANRGLMDSQRIEQAARLLLGARMVYAFGMGGGSSFMADEARHRLARLGLPVASYQDALLQKMVAATLGRDDVVLAFSASGRVPEMLASCDIAREYGARLVAVTALGSPLAARADVLLPVRTLETDFIFKPSASRYAMLMVLDVLATQCALLQPDQSKERLRRLKYVLDSHRGDSGPGKGPDSRQPLGD
ncbi:MurR/RpiR family transcriptional regulator [Cupriavidus alkaliphilus]|uniref:MurR/RpiR family transcriptional regulator n=1 Tax=Cupriavidus alkaliphilus TaxID=942866 RepID=UPI000DC3034A|nr:MurR/RpiR family transcriptional regulator [Cupriavidus alkaliphilus]MBB3015460.1 RpiR family carbohydrate utilization transcriptional regulator [Cupriavidus alkaliphilus]RAS00322.1 RpiR family transcriptional regulator [Cupriavidus alkaliphilus]